MPQDTMQNQASLAAIAARYGAAYANFHQLALPINEFGCLRWTGSAQVILYHYDPANGARRRHATTPAKLAYYVKYGQFIARANLRRLCATEGCIAAPHRSLMGVPDYYRKWLPEELERGRANDSAPGGIEHNPFYPNECERILSEAELDSYEQSMRAPSARIAFQEANALRAFEEARKRNRPAQVPGQGFAPTTSEAHRFEGAHRPHLAASELPPPRDEARVVAAIAAARPSLEQIFVETAQRYRGATAQTPPPQREAEPLAPLLYASQPEGFACLALACPGTNDEAWLLRAPRAVAEAAGGLGCAVPAASCDFKFQPDKEHNDPCYMLLDLRREAPDGRGVLLELSRTDLYAIRADLRWRDEATRVEVEEWCLTVATQSGAGSIGAGSSEAQGTSGPWYVTASYTNGKHTVALMHNPSGRYALRIGQAEPAPITPQLLTQLLKDRIVTAGTVADLLERTA